MFPDAADASAMNTVSPRIAVVIPAYNSSACIKDTLASILGQSQPADEIVVVDDGSTDDTAEVAARFSDKITLIRQQNGGQGSARRRGTAATTAEFLLFLDADDVLKPTALEKFFGALHGEPRAALACCPAEMWSPENPERTHVDTLPRPESERLWETLLYQNSIRTPGCAMIRRTILEEVGGWDADIKLKGNEDWELWLRLAESHPFTSITEPLLKYRVHPTGFSKSRRRMFQSLFVMFARQRARCGSSINRRIAVDTAEWHNCKHILREIWRGDAPVFARIFEIVQTGARPALTFLIFVLPRQTISRMRNFFRTKPV
jgi:glycosyltransferase involved in cell wall biosynthesis